MGVLAKFKCLSIRSFEFGKEVEMSAVCGTSGENKDFTELTPSGQFKINVSNSAPAAQYFEPGEEYYFEITRAEK